MLASPTLPHAPPQLAQQPDDIVVIATGSYLPQRILNNAQMEEICGRNDAWIIERTGVSERHLAAPDETTSDMAYCAAIRACQQAGLDPAELELIVVATVTGETHFPATACWLQAKLGNTRAMPLDVNMGCVGFIYALVLARSLMLDGTAQNALVIGADRVTAITDYTDPRSCILFGDGAGAVLLQRTPPATEQRGLLANFVAADGTKAPLLFRPLDATASPDRPAHASSGAAFMFMEGREVYKHAVRCMDSAVRSVLARAGLLLAQVDWVVPHQANARIIEALAERLGLARERVFANIERVGNTSAASIPLCLDEMNRQGLLHAGQLIALCTFGTGLIWGATLLKWSAAR